MEHPDKLTLDTLTGTFLLSTSQMPDSRFEKQVIYICSHGYDGTIGIAINKPNPLLSLGDVLLTNRLPIPNDLVVPVHIGGPVEPTAAFILYQSDYFVEQHFEVSPTVYLSRNTKVLKDIAHGCGPEKYLFAVGYSGWGPGQLEQELLSQGWLTIPAEDAIIFDVPDGKKWERAAALFGIDISTYQDCIGNA